MNVYILQTFRDGEDEFGNTCVFNTIKKGFPTANIIKQLNHKVDETQHITSHAIWMHNTLYHCNEDEPLVFCDPDIIFYSEIETYLNNIKEYIAGRFVPFYYNEVVEAYEAERFHTSLLYIRDPKELKAFIDLNIKKEDNFPFYPLFPFKFYMSGKALFYDTFANLYHALPKHYKHNFAPEMLDKYTHLCCGSMLNYISSQMKNGERLKFLHELAKKHPEKVQGLWKEHDRYYQSKMLPL